MLAKESLKYIGISALKIGAAFMLLWIVVLFVSRVLFHSNDLVSPILYDGSRLIVPKGSPLREIITVKAVVKEPFTSLLTLPAVVYAIPMKTVRILPPAAGRILSIQKETGDNIFCGEVLFTMSAPDWLSANNDLEKAKAELTLASQTRARQQKLLQARIGSEQDLQQAQNVYDKAMSNLTQARLRLRFLKGKPGVDHLIVRSPLNGSVVEVFAGIGGYWNDEHEPIMTVADLSEIYVVASVQEKDIRHIHLGQAVHIHFDAYSKDYAAHVDHINPMLDKDTHTLDVSMTLLNPKGRFKPNMFARAVFHSRPRQRIVLPLTAVIQRGFESIVFVERAPWQFEVRQVQIGAQQGNQVEIVSGLDVQERVVLTGSVVLND